MQHPEQEITNPADYMSGNDDALLHLLLNLPGITEEQKAYIQKQMFFHARRLYVNRKDTSSN